MIVLDQDNFADGEDRIKAILSDREGHSLREPVAFTPIRFLNILEIRTIAIVSV